MSPIEQKIEHIKKGEVIRRHYRAENVFFTDKALNEIVTGHCSAAAGDAWRFAHRGNL